MDLERYTQKSQAALLAAQHLVQEYHHQHIEPSHLALALIQQEDGVVPAIVTKVAGSVLAIRQELADDLENRAKVYGANTEVGLAPTTSTVLAAAERYAKGMGDEYVSTEHLLLGLTESVEGKRLAQYGLTKDAILKALADVRGSQRVTSATPEDTYQALETYLKALAMTQTTGARADEATVLNNIGTLYLNLEEYLNSITLGGCINRRGS